MICFSESSRVSIGIVFFDLRSLKLVQKEFNYYSIELDYVELLKKQTITR